MRTKLQAGETLAYEDGQGFRVFDAEGSAKATNFVVQVPALLMAPHFATANLTATKTLTDGTSFAIYVGKAPRSLAAAAVRWRLTLDAVGVNWAEVALAKGVLSVGGNPTLTVVGWADVAAPIATPSPPVKTTAINVAVGQTLDAGDDLWVIIGHDVSTTAAQVRAQSIADDLQVGVQASASMRPSLNVGTGVAFTIESASAAAPWVGCLF